MQKPSVGRVVHYVSYGTPGGEYSKECRAAIVTATAPDDSVSLCVMNPTGLFFNTCQHDAGAAVVIEGETQAFRTYGGGTWHWPERVD